MLQLPSGKTAEIDTLVADYNSGYLVVIDIEHHKIHEGKHYDGQDYDSDVDIAGPKYWLVRAPDTDTRVHLIFQVKPSGPGLAEFFENPTTTDDGTEITTYNNNRNSTNLASMDLFKDPTVSVDGTRICVGVIGSTGVSPKAGIGGIADREDELILKQGYDYLVKYSPLVDDEKVSLCLRFYEATPETEYPSE